MSEKFPKTLHLMIRKSASASYIDVDIDDADKLEKLVGEDGEVATYELQQIQKLVITRELRPVPPEQKAAPEEERRAE